MFFKKIFIYFLSFYCFISINLSAEDYYAFVKTKLEQQIQEDLKSYLRGEKIDRKLIEKQVLGKDCRNYLILFKIKNNIVTSKISENVPSDWKNQIVYNANFLYSFFIRLSKKYPLPDVVFLLSVFDHDNDEFFDVPCFTFAKKYYSKNILIPDGNLIYCMLNRRGYVDYATKISLKYPWELKSDTTFFRGSFFAAHENEFIKNKRVQALYYSSKYPDILIADFNYIPEEYLKNFDKIFRETSKSIVPSVSEDFFLNYKYLLDIDGNTCTFGRCRFILSSNSVLLKLQSDNIQWYYKLLIPNVNYIPIKSDFSNLTDTVQYLRNHDEEAKKIAMNGYEIGAYIFSEEMVEYYFVKLLKQWAKCLMSD